MKLAIAAFSTALVLATGASAMIGPYERAIDQALANGDLTSGTQAVVEVRSAPSGPNVEWSADGEKAVTLFETPVTDSRTLGYEGR